MQIQKCCKRAATFVDRLPLCSRDWEWQIRTEWMSLYHWCNGTWSPIGTTRRSNQQLRGKRAKVSVWILWAAVYLLVGCLGSRFNSLISWSRTNSFRSFPLTHAKQQPRLQFQLSMLTPFSLSVWKLISYNPTKWSTSVAEEFSSYNLIQWIKNISNIKW